MEMWSFGTYLFTNCLLHRNLFETFAQAVFGITAQDTCNTVAYKHYLEDDPGEAAFLLKARILVHTPATWYRYAQSVRGFVEFCRLREMSIFECTPSVINLYLLKLAQDGKTFSVIELFLGALSFTYKFFIMPNFVDDKTVCDTKKFVDKVCAHTDNKKQPFGSSEVRLVFDNLMRKVKSIEELSPVDLRTFVMAVLQHKTFCRFSDISKIKLDDMLFHTDYFKLRIRQSKTDQQAKGAWVYVPKQENGFLDAHMLCCLYLHKLGLDNEPEMYLFPPLH